MVQSPRSCTAPSQTCSQSVRPTRRAGSSKSDGSIARRPHRRRDAHTAPRLLMLHAISSFTEGSLLRCGECGASARPPPHATGARHSMTARQVTQHSLMRKPPRASGLSPNRRPSTAYVFCEPPRGEKRMRCFREAHSSLCTKSMAPCDRDPVSCHVVLSVASRAKKQHTKPSQLSTAEPTAGLRCAPVSCGSPQSWWSAQTRLGLAWPHSLASKGRK